MMENDFAPGTETYGLDNLVQDPQLEEDGWVVKTEHFVREDADGRWHSAVRITGPAHPEGVMFEFQDTFATFEEARAHAVSVTERTKEEEER